ncbi:MAG: hypothetical protein DKINENOH_05337 [bacterium]|nr:hypothetical protein [bacterium]
MRNSVIHSLILAVFIVAFFVLACSAIWFVFWFPEKEVATLSQILTQREIIELKTALGLQVPKSQAVCLFCSAFSSRFCV